MVELVPLSVKTGIDVAQAFAVGQLGKRHDEKLIETTELFYIPFALVTRHASPKCMQGQVIHDLLKHEFACIHGSLPWESEGGAGFAVQVDDTHKLAFSILIQYVID